MSEPKLCPYRQFKPELSKLGQTLYASEFAPCLQEECAMYRKGEVDVSPETPGGNRRFVHTGWCGLAGKP